MHVGKTRGGVGGVIVALAWGIGATAAAHASPVARQINDFETGTIQGWTNGTQAPDPVNVSTGGPDATGPHFLRVTARGGNVAGGKLAVFNRSTQWAGNYLTAGITGVETDLKNFGTTPLAMRVALQESAGTRFTDTSPFTLPADGLWHHARFSLAASDLTRSNGSTPAATALTRITELRIIHSVGADFMGDAINSSFGVDNIRAVPEPAAAGLLGLVLAGALTRRCRA
jgi:hypothetical protein